jgi:very-short-patch-repair endonuclease
MEQNIKTTNFIVKARKLHGDKYDYSKVDYINKVTTVKIICPTHGVFEQRPDSHLIGSKCAKCSGKLISCTESFIAAAHKIHKNKFDYSLVTYTNTTTNVKIICPKHGVFETTPNNHMRGTDCRYCSGNDAKKLNVDSFVQRAKKVHGDKYDYSKVNYKNFKTKVSIVCAEHGVFEQTPFNHITNKHGCQICKLSHGERIILNYLNNNNIENHTNFIFNDCFDKKALPFDFYLPKYNICIEFDGIQHYEIVPYFGGLPRFILQQKRDKIKDEYCLKNNIKLIRIRNHDLIETILNKNIW